MALLSTLFTALTRKIGDLLQALFGWSVAALFGRLNSKTRMLVTIGLVLSLCWPIFVLGVFFPAAATFVLAFVPLESPTVKLVLRVVWFALAIAAPAVVGLLVRAAVPLEARKSVPRTLLNGYPLTLGMALSFLVTLVTVPLVKLVSIARRWKEEHVYVQPRVGRYDDVLGHLVSASRAAGYTPRVEPVPARLALSTRVLKVFSRGAIDMLITSHPRRVMSEGLELYLYPADLLIRGEPRKLAAVRARLTATKLERDAYLVQDKKAQDLQDELGRVWDVLDEHQHAEEARPGLMARLEQISKDAWNESGLSFDDWLALDRMARRLEGELRELPSRLDEIARAPAAHAPTVTELLEPPRPLPLEASMPELVAALAHESRALLALETALARDEAMAAAEAAKRSAIGFSLGISFGGAVAAMLGVALVLALGGSAVTALIIAGSFMVAALVIGAISWNVFPKNPLAHTRSRVGTDLKLLLERAS